MLEKLILQNFQKYKQFEIEFDPYVTIIVGPNDSGKSIIIRALQLLCFNRPVGNACIRHGRKQSILQLFFDGIRLKRVVGKNGLYRLGKKPFKALRKGVPPEIAAALSVSELNFQYQHKPLFWFDLTPGQAAKELNKLVDLESIDLVQTAVAKQLREKKAELAVARKRLELAKTVCSRYRPAKQLNVKLGKIDKLMTDMALKSHRIDSLALLCGQAVGAASIIETAASTAANGHVASVAGALAVDAGYRVERLGGLVEQLEGLKRLMGLSIPQLPERPKPNTKLQKLENLLIQNESEEGRMENLKIRRDKAKFKLEKRLGGRCPTCGGILTDKSLI